MKIDNVEIDKSIVIKFLGYSKRPIPKNIEKIIDEEIHIINDILDINVFVEEIDTKNHDFTGEYIKENIQKSDKAYAVLYTIGNKIEEKINKCTYSNDMIRGYVLDKIGIVALDYVNDYIKNNLRLQNKLNISAEVYPGNKDFEVSNQRKIYEYVENDIININEYNQINPIKSVAMILGLGQSENCISRCDICENKCI